MTLDPELRADLDESASTLKADLARMQRLVLAGAGTPEGRILLDTWTDFMGSLDRWMTLANKAMLL